MMRFPANQRHWISVKQWVLVSSIMMSTQAIASPSPQGVTIEKIATGTAFCVDADGIFLTAHHVVKGRDAIALGQSGAEKFVKAQLMGFDADLDVALIKGSQPCKPFEIADWSTVPIGLDVVVLGYPSPTFLGRSLKITGGLISGYRRVADTVFQLSAAVQKGNSGGPVISLDGLLVGLVQRKLDALKMAERNGDLVQNVSYAVNAAALCRFLEANGMKCNAKPLAPSAEKKAHAIYEDHLRSTWMVMAFDGQRAAVQNP